MERKRNFGTFALGHPWDIGTFATSAMSRTSAWDIWDISGNALSRKVFYASCRSWDIATYGTFVPDVPYVPFVPNGA